MASQDVFKFKIELEGDAGRELEKISRALGAVEGALRPVQRGFTATKKGLSSLASPAAAIGESLLASFGAAVTGAIYLTARAISDVTRESMELEQALTRAAAVTNEGVANFGAFKESAVDAAGASAFSAKEAAGALEFFSMAGLSAKDATDALAPSLSLAAASGNQLGQTADILTNIMTSYGKSASELTEVNDALVATFTRSNTNLQGLGDAFKFVGPVAKASSQDFELVAASIGLMGNAGIQGSMAGRQLRMALVRLQKPPKEAAAALRIMGVETVDATGKMRGLDQILTQIRDAGARVEDLAAIFGVEAAPGIQALIDQGPERIRSFADELGRANGIAKQIESIQLDTLAGQFQIAEGAIETLQARFGDTFANSIKEVVKEFNTLMSEGQILGRALFELKQVFLDNEEAIRIFGTASLSVAVGVLDTLIQNFTVLFELGVKLIGPIRSLSMWVASFSGITDEATAIAFTFAKALKVLGIAAFAWVAAFMPIVGILGIVAVAFTDLEGPMTDVTRRMKEMERQANQVTLAKFRKEVSDLATGIDSLDLALSGFHSSYKDLEKVGTDVGNVFLALADNTVVQFKEGVALNKEREAQLERINKVQAQERDIAFKKLLILNETNEATRARLQYELEILQAQAKGLTGLDLSVAREEARAKRQRVINRLAKRRRQEMEREAKAAQKLREEEEAREKRIAQTLRTRLREVDLAEQELEALRQTDPVLAATIRYRSQINDLRNQGLVGAELELERYRTELGFQERLQEIEEEREEKRKEAARTREEALSKEAEQYREIAGAFRAMEGVDAEFASIARALEGVSNILADAVENQHKYTLETKEGGRAIAGALGLAGQSVSSFASALGASAAQQAGLLAGFEAASAVASFASGNIPAGVQHSIAAGLYAGVAAKGGASPVTAGSSGVGGGSAAPSSAGSFLGGGEDAIRRAADINAAALANILGEAGAGNVTVVVDNRGALLMTDDPEAQEFLANSAAEGLRRQGTDVRRLEYRRERV